MASRRRRKDEVLIVWLFVVVVLLVIVTAIVQAVEAIWPLLVGGALALFGWDALVWWKARRRGEARELPVVSRRVLRWLPAPMRWWRGRLRWQRVNVHALGELMLLTPSDFEKAVATLLEENGYRAVEWKGRSGDLGVDVSCVSPWGAKTIVQCKRKAPGYRVGSPDMQLFVGMLHHPGLTKGST